MKRDLLSLADLKPQEIEKLLDRARFFKKRRLPLSLLRGKSLAMIFEKASTRTHVSFEVAMHELGGHPVYLSGDSCQLGRGETYADTARVLSRYVHGIMIRTYSQKIVEEIASEATVPVINGLSDLFHPCQLLTDLFTIREFKKDLKKSRVAYVGDGNNMANSWMEASEKLKFPLFIATPKGYEPPAEIRQRFEGEKQIQLGNDPADAVSEADVINTDTWFSMGQEVSEGKRRAFGVFQVNEALLKRAKKDVLVLHCLPAHRGEEITDEVLDGPQSKVWDQAENRLHVQKAILEMLI